MHCLFCNKNNIDPLDMHNDTMCDDCFDLSMEYEELDIKISAEQNHLCFICGKEFTGSIAKEIDGYRRIVCWPLCDHDINKVPPLRITSDMFTGITEK